MRDTQSLIKHGYGGLGNEAAEQAEGVLSASTSAVLYLSFIMFFHHSNYASFNRYELQIVKG